MQSMGISSNGSCVPSMLQGFAKQIPQDLCQPEPRESPRGKEKMGDFAVFWCLLTIATHCCMLLSLCKFGDKQWDEQSMASWARPHCHFPLRKCKPLFKSVKVGKSGSVLRRRLEAM